MNDTLTETSLKIINCYIYTTNLQLQKVLAWLMNIRDLTMLYVKQADHLRQETLEQMSRILTITSDSNFNAFVGLVVCVSLTLT